MFKNKSDERGQILTNLHTNQASKLERYLQIPLPLAKKSSCKMNHEINFTQKPEC